MSLRLPLTIWVHTLAELTKLVLLTTTVLVTVIAFAMSVKFLADGKLDPFDTFRAMVLAMVPALQYALPFAACFGATLAYHRLASENELTAAYAGGVSHRALLVPACVTGVVLSLVLLGLTQMVIPKMLKRITELVSSDAARVFVSQIERGQAVAIDNTLIYADKVVRQPAPQGYNDALLLLGVLVVKLNNSGKIDSQVAARSATVWTRPSVMNPGTANQKPATEIIIKTAEIVGSGAFGSGSNTGKSGETLISEKVPTGFSNDPKFADARELDELERRPEFIGSVDRARVALALEIAEREVVERLRAALRDAGQVDLKKPDGERWLLKAGNLRPVRTEGKIDPSVYQIVPVGGRTSGAVTLERIMPDGKLQRQSAASALIRFTGRGEPGHTSAMFTIVLRDVVVDVIGGSDYADLSADELTLGKAEGKERPVPDLALLNDPLDEYLKKSSGDVLTAAQSRISDRGPDKDHLKEPARRLVDEIDDLVKEIMSKRHERYAQSLACLIMILVGAIMAMRLRDALPLTIYLWAFFPALFTVLTISGGQQLTHGKGVAGLSLLYAGVAALAAFAAFEYSRLSKH